MDETHLASIAAQLVARVRDDETEDNARWLQAELPNPGDWFRLCFVLAAAVPDDEPWSDLIAWTRPQDHPQRRAYEAVRDERFAPVRRGAA